MTHPFNYLMEPKAKLEAADERIRLYNLLATYQVELDKQIEKGNSENVRYCLLNIQKIKEQLGEE